MKKFYSYIIIPLFVSFIYSRIIDPNLNNTFLYIGNFFASISTSYLDFIYENIGDGIKEVFSYYTYAFTFGLAIMMCFFIFITSSLISFIKMTKNDTSEAKENIKLKLNKIKAFKSFKYDHLIITFMSLVLFIYALSATIKHHYTYNAIVYFEKTLDILAPKIDENRRLELKAKYRTVNSYDSFTLFNNELIEIAKEKKIKIPEFKIIMK